MLSVWRTKRAFLKRVLERAGRGQGDSKSMRQEWSGCGRKFATQLLKVSYMQVLQGRNEAGARFWHIVGHGDYQTEALVSGTPGNKKQLKISKPRSQLALARQSSQESEVRGKSGSRVTI